jgi:hypothetical protein
MSTQPFHTQVTPFLSKFIGSPVAPNSVYPMNQFNNINSPNQTFTGSTNITALMAT